MAQNLVEKIAQKYAVDIGPGAEIHSGDYMYIKPEHVLTHDNTGAVIPKFQEIGATRMANPRQPVYALDHNVQDTGEKNIAKYVKIEAFAKSHGVDFYPAGRGIGHQIMCEEGYVWPGTMVVASDSHSNMYGGLGCLGTPVVRTDAAALWATGRTWWQVPPVAHVELTGAPNPGVTGKDIIIALCGHFNGDEVLNHAIEFTGAGLGYLSVDQRLTIANMSTEWGALAGIFPTDDITLKWLQQRIAFIAKRGLENVPSDVDGNGAHPRMNRERLAELERDILSADSTAHYSRKLTLNLSTVQPCIAGPNSVKTMNTAVDLAGRNIRIHKAYLVSCVNSRLEDIAEAAKVIDGRKVADGVEFYIAAASNEVQMEAEQRGYWKKLLDAGAIPLPPGCGPCIGLGAGLLEEGEVGISATNRNFKGRMGSPDAAAYLASPAVVAASAVAGKIQGPTTAFADRDISASIQIPPAKQGESRVTGIIAGFPERIEGEIIFCHQDNMNTDGIFPGKYTYQDDFTPEQQAEVVLENYDPEFAGLARSGDILVGGFNFGTGSSREQAATALKYKGIRMVIAGSFSETYRRNALNNGFLIVEAPDLVRDLKQRLGTDSLTVRSGIHATLDVRDAIIRMENREYPVPPVGTAAQDLIVCGGLEEWVKKRMSEQDSGTQT